MDYLKKKLIGDIECRSVEGIEESFQNGVDPNDYFNNEPLIYELTSEYGRTSRFKDCVRAFTDAGLKFDNKELLAVLSDDAGALDMALRSRPDAVRAAYTLRCAYTPLNEASLLHVCAEFNHLSCAKVLVSYGADMMQYLLLASADLHITVPGLIWGKGYPWETLIPAVNPISYAMMGLLPQMHRSEKRITEIVSQLLRTAYDIDYIPANIPNAYLK